MERFCCARDMEAYRTGYPGADLNSKKLDANLKFYQSKLKPNGFTIEEVLQFDHIELERRHDYIQWLFPIYEKSSFNDNSQILQRHEAERLQQDPVLLKKYITAYKVMLNFFGLRVVNEETGEIERAWNWEDRYKNLHTRTHNHMRITRILKSLGEMRLEQWKLPFVKHWIKEILVHGHVTSAKDSLLNYWIFSLRNTEELKEAQQYILELTNVSPKKRGKHLDETPRKNDKQQRLENKRGGSTTPATTSSAARSLAAATTSGIPPVATARSSKRTRVNELCNWHQQMSLMFTINQSINSKLKLWTGGKITELEVDVVVIGASSPLCSQISTPSSPSFQRQLKHLQPHQSQYFTLMPSLNCVAPRVAVIETVQSEAVLSVCCEALLLQLTTCSAPFSIAFDLSASYGDALSLSHTVKSIMSSIANWLRTEVHLNSISAMVFICEEKDAAVVALLMSHYFPFISAL